MKELFLGIITAIAFIGLGGYFINNIDKSKCERFGILKGMPYQYEIIGGCYVKDGDTWRKPNEFRVIGE